MTEEKKPEAPFLNLTTKVNESGQFKRPDHPDFMTFSELQKIKFTGVRSNKIMQDYEFWAEGEIRGRVSHRKAVKDPGLMARKHLSVYGMVPPEENGIVVPQAKETRDE